jgi:6,7-dimethyl-8-ribityllumazine synthase
MKEIQLQTPARRPKIALVVSEFNRVVTDQLLQGALAELSQQGLGDEDLLVAWVPGAFELPIAADWVFSAGLADAVVALGAVIRGETAHFDYVANESARGLMEVGLKHGKPAIFGVLTTENGEQAIERAAVDRKNKGGECALAALHMLGLAGRLENE